MSRAKKTILFAGVVVTAWGLLVLLVTVFVEGTLWITGEFGLQHALGMDTQTTHNYASVSGALPIFIAILGFSSIGATAWRRINCHVDGCLRIGKHRMAGGKYVICTHCLKRGQRAQEITVEHVHDSHARHHGVIQS